QFEVQKSRSDHVQFTGQPRAVRRQRFSRGFNVGFGQGGRLAGPACTGISDKELTPYPAQKDMLLAVAVSLLQQRDRFLESTGVPITAPEVGLGPERLFVRGPQHLLELWQ